MTSPRGSLALVTAAALAFTLTGCGGSSSSGKGETITVLAHDSFTPTDAVLAQFTTDTGIEVKVVKGGDAGEVVGKAVLTAGHPLGDVLFGVDNTLLSKALGAKLFAEYASPELGKLTPGLSAQFPDHHVTPIDTGDVCVNVDVAAMGKRSLSAPTSLDDLVKPQYKDLLVVENPATSSPGLAFLLATEAAYGDGWSAWWAKLRANGVKVVDGWDQAYNSEFSGSAGGKTAGASRPLVVSYASSPPAEVMFADPKPTTAPTSVMTSSCFRQVEFAGVLAGTKHAKAAQRFIDFLLSDAFQADMPATMFVFPARDGVTLPEEFVKYAARPDKPASVDPAAIAANRDKWIDTWTATVLR